MSLWCPATRAAGAIGYAQVRPASSQDSSCLQKPLLNAAAVQAKGGLGAQLSTSAAIQTDQGPFGSVLADYSERGAKVNGSECMRQDIVTRCSMS